MFWNIKLLLQYFSSISIQMNTEFIFSRTLYFRDDKLLWLKECRALAGFVGHLVGKKGYCHGYAVSQTSCSRRNSPLSRIVRNIRLLALERLREKLSATLPALHLSLFRRAQALFFSHCSPAAQGKPREAFPLPAVISHLVTWQKQRWRNSSTDISMGRQLQHVTRIPNNPNTPIAISPGHKSKSCSGPPYRFIQFSIPLPKQPLKSHRSQCTFPPARHCRHRNDSGFLFVSNRFFFSIQGKNPIF